MRVFEALNKYHQKIDYLKSEEYLAYSEYALKIDSITFFRELLDAHKDFALIQYLVLVRAIKNKEFIEQHAKELKGDKSHDITCKIKESLISHQMPYLKFNENKYYVPIFPYSIDSIYSIEPYKLNASPYDDLEKNFADKIVDLFFSHGTRIYDSKFTNLIKIKEHDNFISFYHPYFKTIYVINEQGKLEKDIPLFDVFIKEDSNDLMDRLIRVVDAFFSNSVDIFKRELYNTRFISKKLYEKIKL